MTKVLKILPNHIGIIMDGNGRWATRQGLPRNVGHKEGMAAVERTVDALIKFKVPMVTFFAFSTENWKRSKEEIDGIFDLIRDYLNRQKDDFLKKGVKITSIGDTTKFPQDLQDELNSMKETTKDCNKLTVNLALNYGGRADIVSAVNKLLKSGTKEVNEKVILDNLQTGSMPEPDFIIRTSGEMRLSNFMMYQAAYSELYFPSVLWPDFNERHLLKSLKVFSKRNRRFGGIK